MLSVAHDEEATQVTVGSRDLHSQVQPVPEEDPHFSVDNFLPSQMYGRKFSVCVCVCMRHVPNDILHVLCRYCDCH